MIKKSILLFLVFGCLIGCSTKKEIIYFQDLAEEEIPQPDTTSIYPKIQVNDILKIDVTALNEEAVLPFKFEKIAMAGNNSTEMMKMQGYVVGEDGTINFPRLGEIQAKGMTTRGFQRKMEGLLSVYIKDPSVKVRLLNFKITVLGEVNSPGVINLSEESITLPQALGLAGDLTIKGERKIRIVRTVDGKRVTEVVDMTNTDWMQGPYYYLKQNDLIYVTPNPPRIASAGFVGNVGTLLSVVSILMSAVVLLSR